VSTEVKILGKTYSIRSEYDDRFTNETAELVNSRMRELMGKMGPVAPEKIAVLTAMNLAGEILRTRREDEDRLTHLRQKTSQIIKLIDSQV
jgi:cell division protein ZapA (FtsZ GTPase activity inhibitor)